MQHVYMQTFKPTAGLKKKKKERKSMIRKRMKGKQCMASSAKHEVSSPANVGDSNLGSHCDPTLPHARGSPAPAACGWRRTCVSRPVCWGHRPPLCCQLCRLSASPFDAGPSPALCLAHSRHSGGICWLIELSLQCQTCHIWSPAPGAETPAVSVAQHT